jgi:hypothetical protein
MHISTAPQFRKPTTKITALALILGFLGGYFLYGVNVTSSDQRYIQVRAIPPGSAQGSVHIAIAPQSQCQTRLERLIQRLEDACPKCALNTVACGEKLDDRFQAVVDNVPFAVSYFSMNSPQERHFVWGLSPAEQKDYCNLMKEKFPSGRCILPD